MVGYWEQFANRQFNRRRILASAGFGLGAAALLAACGKSDKSATEKNHSGLLVPVEDETKAAKVGGTYTGGIVYNLITLDPHVGGNHVGETGIAYDGLLRIAPGYLKPSEGSIEGAIAESWEYSPDKTTVTMKLKPNVHFAPVEPVNGRLVDTQDVVFSWEHLKAIGLRRSELANDVDPTAPIVSIVATDPRTIVIKFKAPNATALLLLVGSIRGDFMIVPKDAENPTRLDLRRTQAGTGPFYLTRFEPSVGETMTRNPAYQHDKQPGPFFDKIEYFNLPEYATQLPQFRKGTLLNVFQGVKPEDLITTKSDVPALEIQETDLSTSPVRTFFGKQPSAFTDERVRQAWQMTIDRDALLDVAYNVSKFEQAGLPVSTAWDTALPASSFAGWWLDPKGKNFGPNAKYFQYNVAEATKLLAAAGYANGVDAQVTYPPTGYGNMWYQHLQILLGMPADSRLFRLTHNQPQYSEFQTRFLQDRVAFNGVAFLQDRTAPDPMHDLVSHYSSSGALYFNGDSTMEDILSKASVEFDTGKRMELAYEVQRHDAQKVYFPRIGGATGFSLDWPAVRNRSVYRGGHALQSLFMDQDKPPFKAA